MDADILKGRFVNRVMSEVGNDLNKDVSRVIATNGFRSDKWNKRSISSSDNGLIYSHLASHRFVNMKKNTINGQSIKKHSYPIHNQIIMSHYNNIIRELKYGFTAAVKMELLNIEKDL